MHLRARSIAGLAITVTVAGVVAASGFTTAAAATLSCTDPTGLSGQALASCITTLRQQADSAGKDAAKADEAYLKAKQQTADAKKVVVGLSGAADRAALVAQRSRARAAAVAAQFARTGGNVGPTAQVLLSGSGASEVLYHLSRMTELTADTSQLADVAKRDQAQAVDLRQQASSAADRLASDERAAKALYDTAKKTASAATLLVATAQQQQNPGSNTVFVQAYANLPANSSVAQTVIAYARAQIGKPYVFGAAGPGSFDCSGLTMAAFATTGRNIGGHGVNVQYRLAQSRGQLVSYSSVQPGDLLFYGSGDYYHVAIYSGNGSMIEAPYPGRPVREVPVRTADLAPLVARFTS